MGRIIGVTIGWSGKLQLCFENGKIYYNSKLDKIFHPEYFINTEWPIDPKTKNRLEIVV